VEVVGVVGVVGDEAIETIGEDLQESAPESAYCSLLRGRWSEYKENIKYSFFFFSEWFLDCMMET
jgi:hypothetical protein